jgi:drug/metabolite transporter (DMT)-like permease
MIPTNRPRLHPSIALLLLSTLWAMNTLLPGLLPNLIPGASTLPASAKLFLPCSLLAFAATAWALVHRRRWPTHKQILPPILTGLGLFVAPYLLMSLPKPGINPYTQTVLLTLVPVFCLILEPHILSRPTQPSRLALPAALAAVFGAICVFPFQFPNSPATTLSFCAAMLAVISIATATCLATGASGIAPSSFAAIANATAAIGLALTSLFHGPPIWSWRPGLPELLWPLAVDLPALLILFWLFRRTSATRTATRYLFTPLLAILAGAALLHLPLTPRTCAGLLLLAIGATYLLFAPAAEPDSTTLSLTSK